MSKLSDAGKPGELPKEGEYKARVVGFIDLGTQEVEYEGKKSEQRKCNVEFALDMIKGKSIRSDGKPFIVSRRYTYSPSERGTLRKELRRAWGITTSDYDMADLIGLDALVTIVHDDEGKFANIDKYDNDGVKKLISGKPNLPKGIKTRTLFLDENFDQDVFDSLSDKTKATIMLSPEYDKIHVGKKPKSTTKKKTKK
jgi:hypothetical protein